MEDTEKTVTEALNNEEHYSLLEQAAAGALEAAPAEAPAEEVVAEAAPEAAEAEQQEPAPEEAPAEEVAAEAEPAVFAASHDAGPASAKAGSAAKPAGSSPKRRRRNARLAFACVGMLILAAVLGFLILTMTVKNSSSPVGFWIIKEAASGDVVMTEEDAKAIGLTKIGAFRLDKSGDCSLVILESEYAGKWTVGDDGRLNINYGDGLVLYATIDEEGVMTATDDVSMRYTLEK